MLLAQKLQAAAERPENWDIPGLLNDAADTIRTLEMALASARPLFVANYDQLRCQLDMLRRGDTPEPLPAYPGEWDRCDHVLQQMDEALKMFRE